VEDVNVGGVTVPCRAVIDGENSGNMCDARMGTEIFEQRDGALVCGAGGFFDVEYLGRQVNKLVVRVGCVELETMECRGHARSCFRLEAELLHDMVGQSYGADRNW